MRIKDFAYGGLMKCFYKISSIPRPTYHEEKIADYICGFARDRGFEYYRDKANNVFVKLKGSVGREREPAILLQGHTDMVCEKNEGTEHDFLTEGLELYEDNGWLRARGTTLGADNGVAVAIMLYILDGAEGHLPSHPPIECLFTASEEVGLDGAKSFDYSLISARRMINMDSADESQILTGCAGGCRTTLEHSFKREEWQGEAVRVSVKGLAGGHSGEDIDKNRANASILLAKAIVMAKGDIRLVSFNGGSKDNAIPREASAVVVTADSEALISALKEAGELLLSELGADDRGFRLTAELCKASQGAMNKSDTEDIIGFIANVENGIFEMNKSIPTLVETSRNLGIVSTEEESLRFAFLSRSPSDSKINGSKEQLEGYAKSLGMKVKHGNYYPGWSYAEVSPLRDTYAKVYRELLGSEVEMTTIHAGLECGIIKQRIPDMDIISCGPVVVALHSPDESMDIASFERFFTIIKNVIAK